MAKDTFNLHEWVGNGEKNLLKEEEQLDESLIGWAVAGAISGIFAYIGGLRNDPEDKKFFAYSKGVIKGILQSFLLFGAWKYRVIIGTIILKATGYGALAVGGFYALRKAIDAIPNLSKKEKAKGKELIDEIEKADKKAEGDLTGDELADALGNIKRELDKKLKNGKR